MVTGIWILVAQSGGILPYHKILVNWAMYWVDDSAVHNTPTSCSHSLFVRFTRFTQTWNSFADGRNRHGGCSVPYYNYAAPGGTRWCRCVLKHAQANGQDCRIFLHTALA